jgi:uncharacterized membrane protein YhaH (DUF805 family)
MGYFDALLRYFEFSGRTTRGQYWMFQLCYAVLVVGAIYLDHQGNFAAADLWHPGLFSTFVLIFHVFPQLTVAVRRLHDIGRSGWWWLLNIVPLAGLLLFVWSFYGSEIGANAYGDDPHDTPRGDRPAGKPKRSSPASAAAQQMLVRMEARRGSSRIAS